MFCTKCGKKISLGAEFCGFCGTPITQEQEEIRDLNQNIKSVKSDYSSDWSNKQSDWGNKQNDSRLDRRKKHETSQMEEAMKKATKKTWFYRFFMIFTPIVVFGGLIMGFEVMVVPATILTILIGIPLYFFVMSLVKEYIIFRLLKIKVLSTILLIPSAIAIIFYAYDRWGVFMASMMGLGSIIMYREIWFGTEKKKK